MSAINITNQIPTSIVTVEQLHVWSGLALGFMFPTTKVVETELGAVNCIQSGIFQAADQSTRIFIRTSIELDGSYVQDRTSKLWMKAKELGNVVIPTGYTSN